MENSTVVIFRDESPRRKLDRLVDEVMTCISGSNVAVVLVLNELA